MPSSPATPSRTRRRSSGVSAHLPRNTSQTSISSPSGRSHSRRSSSTSLFSVTTPRPTSAHSSGILPDLGSSLHGVNGLGSLADELAEEQWDEDIDEEDEYAGQLDGATSVATSPALRKGEVVNKLSPPIVPESKREYDGSDYGDDSDLEEVAGISKTLEARMAAIEALARQSVGDHDTGGVKRVSEQLRELSSQANVETGIARLSTAHSAITTNLGHQSRQLTALTQKLLSPLTAPPIPEVAEDLSMQLNTLLLALPQPITQTLTSAHSLHDLSAELASSLEQLGDTLQMTRQTTNSATRWLRSAVEAVETLRRELDEAEEGRVWLERNRCAERLRKREAAQSCREVVQGFEEVCDDWRARLVRAAQVEVTS